MRSEQDWAVSEENCQVWFFIEWHSSQQAKKPTGFCAEKNSHYGIQPKEITSLEIWAKKIIDKKMEQKCKFFVQVQTDKYVPR